MYLEKASERVVQNSHTKKRHPLFRMASARKERLNLATEPNQYLVP